MFALCSYKKFAIIVCAAALLITASAFAQDDDPPSEAGRISYISGNVSVQAVTSEEWGQAYPNLPVGPGDRIFTDSDGRAEIQIGQTYFRIGPNSDVTLVDDSAFNIHVGVAQGSIRLHSYGLWPRQLLDISTPNGNAEFGNSGDLRVDVLPNDGATVFTNLGQFADITAAGDFRQQLDNGQSLELAGSNPVYPQWLQPAGPDGLDSWSQQRDQQLARAVSYQYASPEIPGVADLDAHGDWQPQTEYGAVWFPRDVPADWQPYRNGHWINRPPWGWVWVEDESWGYAPFHYGRWVSYNNRWGWVPGPVNVRPVWSPALVVFAGGVHFGGDASLSVWFPLGPGEAYRPWYRCSPGYIDRVNITNIREAPRVRVQRSYVNVVNVTNITYINQAHGGTGMRHDDFASGRSGRNVAVRVDPREMQQARALQQPNVAPPTRTVVSRPVARPVPVSIQRPLLINQQGKQITAKPGAVPVAPPVRNEQHVRPLPGRTVVAAPAHGVPNRVQGNQFPPTQGNQNQRPDAPNSPYPGGAPRANPVAPVQSVQRPFNPEPGNPHVNQNPPANPNQRQQPNERQQQVPQPVAPGVQPTGRPVPAPQNMQQDRNNPQNAPYPGGAPRANPVPPGHEGQRPMNPQANPNLPANNNERQQVPQPVAPGVQPTGRPIPAPQNMQQDRPNNQQRNYEQQQQLQNRPQQQNPQPPQMPPQQQNRPQQQTPQPPQNQPERPNHQDFGPPQQNRHNEAPPPPANNPPQERQAPPPQHQREVMPPQRPVQQPQERQAPPPPQQREAPQQRQDHQDRPAPPPPNHQVAPPPPQNKPQPNNQKPPNNKDQKKDDKKHD
jgi:Family of unknown function (DUF6600)